MDSRNKQIPAPKTWQSFEDLCLSLFKAIWRAPYAQKNGRLGQPQHGVDVFGSPDQDRSRYHGVQCKGKDLGLGAAVSRQELLDEIAKAEAFTPALQHWVLATTAPADAELQRVAREVSVARERQGKFTVTVLGWSEIENLLCDHPEVLKLHYPELGIDAGLLLQQIKQAVNYADADTVSVPPVAASSWRHVDFQSVRDIGPALLGRPLGPSDALACPRLPEADRAVRQLETAFSARIVGVPGAGKSVCAYQVAHSFAQRGWKVFSIKASEGILDNLPSTQDEKVLLLVDDAHLIAEQALKSAEDRAGSRLLVLSTYIAEESDESQRGSVRMDPAAGIQAIAAGLLASRRATLEAVRRADSHVGDLMLDTALEERIAHAVQYARVPWQFCFVLGGGWRRANDAVGTARALKLDLLLGAIAIRQLASRDASPTRQNIAELLVAAGLSIRTFEDDLRRLVHERLVISESDLRCPHQRLAAVLLGRLLQHQDDAGRAAISAMLKAIFADSAFPLAGLSTLLHELHFADYGRWKGLINKSALEPVLDRCWSASDPEERMRACFVLNEAVSYIDTWERDVIGDNEEKLAGWIENAVDPMGHGLMWLLNTLLNQKEEYAKEIIRSTNPQAIAELISSVNMASVWHVAELAKTLRLGASDEWALEVVHNLDHGRLHALAASWPEQEPLFRIVRFFEALAWPAEALTLDLVEAFLPLARRRLIADPVEAFRDLDDLTWHVLRVLDPLGVYKGKLAPTARHLKLARSLLDGIDLRDLATKLSKASLRNFQQVSYFIAFTAKCSPAKADKLVQLMDWKAIGLAIGDHWRHLPHEAEVLFGVAARSAKSREPVVALIRNNLDRIDTMPARLAVIAPELAVEFVRQGRSIALTHFDHVEWQYGAFVIALFVEKDPPLLPTVLAQCIPTMAKSLAQPNESWYKESATMLEGMLEHSPASLQLVLDQVDVESACAGWSAAWAAGGAGRKTVTVLLKAAKSRSDALGKFASQFRPPRKAKSKH
jgi:hypothetical protein